MRGGNGIAGITSSSGGGLGACVGAKAPACWLDTTRPLGKNAVASELVSRASSPNLIG